MENIFEWKKGKRSNRSRHPLQQFALNTSLSPKDFDAAHILMTLANSHIPAISPNFLIDNKKPTKRKRIASSKLHGFANNLGMVEFDECKVESSYSCKTCSREFFSFQALGGHSASGFKKPKSFNGVRDTQEAEHLQIHEEEASGLANGDPGNFQSFHGSKGIFPNVGTRTNNQRARVHRCPVCERVFSCGQALGGHQRSHKIPVSPIEIPPLKSFCIVDLNMPAPLHDVEDGHENSDGSCSQIVTYRLPHHYDQKFELGLGLGPFDSRLQWASTNFHTNE